MSTVPRLFSLAALLLVTVALGPLAPGCASTVPTSYQQSAVPMVRPPLPPRPTYTPAGAGLPVYSPGQQPQGVPRSTDKRLLPPSKEAGVWAASSTDDKLPLNPPSIAGVPVPIPKTATLYDRNMLIPYCVVTMDGCMKREAVTTLIMGLSMQARQCVAAHLYAQCMSAIDGVRPKHLLEPVIEDGESYTTAHLRTTADTWFVTSCSGVQLGTAEANAVNKMVKCWNDMFMEFEK